MGSPTAVNTYREPASKRDSAGHDAKAGYALQSSLHASAMQRHRRSPTAPEPPTTSGSMAQPALPPVGKTWAGNDGRDSLGDDGEHDGYYAGNQNGAGNGSSGEVNPRKQSMPPPPPPQQPHQQQQSAQMRPPPVPVSRTQSAPQGQSFNFNNQKHFMVSTQLSFYLLLYPSVSCDLMYTPRSTRKYIKDWISSEREARRGSTA